MDDDHMFVLQGNISRFRKLLKDPLSDQMRKTIEGLLAEAELELVPRRAQPFADAWAIGQV
jgi:hypothetical protein